MADAGSLPRVPYRWTEIDNGVALGGKAPEQGDFVTPYGIPASAVARCFVTKDGELAGKAAQDLAVGERFHIELSRAGQEGEMWRRTSRFHHTESPYHWIKLDEDEVTGKTIRELIETLSKKHPERFPALIYDTAKIADGASAVTNWAQMLIDYWENTTYRFWLTKSKAWANYARNPGSIECDVTDADGTKHRLRHVLARKHHHRPKAISLGTAGLVIPEPKDIKEYVLAVEKSCRSVRQRQEEVNGVMESRFRKLQTLAALRVLADAMAQNTGHTNVGNAKDLLGAVDEVLTGSKDILLKEPIRIAVGSMEEIKKELLGESPRYTQDAVADLKKEYEVLAELVQRKDAKAATTRVVLAWADSVKGFLPKEPSFAAIALDAKSLETIADEDVAARLSHAVSQAEELLAQRPGLDTEAALNRIQALLDKTPAKPATMTDDVSAESPTEILLTLFGKGAEETKSYAELALAEVWIYSSIKFARDVGHAFKGDQVATLDQLMEKFSELEAEIGKFIGDKKLRREMKAALAAGNQEKLLENKEAFAKGVAGEAEHVGALVYAKSILSIIATAAAVVEAANSGKSDWRLILANGLGAAGTVGETALGTYLAFGRALGELIKHEAEEHLEVFAKGLGGIAAIGAVLKGGVECWEAWNRGETEKALGKGAGVAGSLGVAYVSVTPLIVGLAKVGVKEVIKAGLAEGAELVAAAGAEVIVPGGAIVTAIAVICLIASGAVELQDLADEFTKPLHQKISKQLLIGFETGLGHYVAAKNSELGKKLKEIKEAIETKDLPPPIAGSRSELRRIGFDEETLKKLIDDPEIAAGGVELLKKGLDDPHSTRADRHGTVGNKE